MPRIRVLSLILLTVVLALLGACREKSAPPAPTVRANQAYLAAFGQPPVPAKGECFARVGYYPLRDDPGKLQAVPFFLFSKQTELPLLFARLVDNPQAFAAGPLRNPFPGGSQVQVGPLAATLELQLKLPQPQPEAGLALMAASLVETAAQYPEVKRVRLQLNGAAWPGMPADGFQSDPGRIVPPGPPQLLLVIGSWGQGAADPKEILADFDRPVTVDGFSLTDDSGRELLGDYYAGVFDMAVVLHPASPTMFHQGQQLKAQWRVTDKLGRIGEGEGVFPLQRHDEADAH